MRTSINMTAKSCFKTHRRAASPEFARTMLGARPRRSSFKAWRLFGSSSTTSTLACDAFASMAPMLSPVRGMPFERRTAAKREAVLVKKQRRALEPALSTFVWSCSDHADLGQRKAVEVTRVCSGVGAGVLDIDIVALLQVRGQRLVTHHHVDRVASRAGDVPGDVGPGAVGADLVFQAFSGLDDPAEKPRIQVHPALACAGRRSHDAADKITGVRNQEPPRFRDHLYCGRERF